MHGWTIGSTVVDVKKILDTRDLDWSVQTVSVLTANAMTDYDQQVRMPLDKLERKKMQGGILILTLAYQGQDS